MPDFSADKPIVTAAFRTLQSRSYPGWWQRLLPLASELLKRYSEAPTGEDCDTADKGEEGRDRIEIHAENGSIAPLEHSDHEDAGERNRQDPVLAGLARNVRYREGGKQLLMSEKGAKRTTSSRDQATRSLR